MVSGSLDVVVRAFLVRSGLAQDVRTEQGEDTSWGRWGMGCREENSSGRLVTYRRLI